MGEAMTDGSGWSLDMEAGPIYVQIGIRVREQLARGDLKAGEKLPSARDLASRLSVNPNTVVHAFERLEADGVVETKRGLGTFVREDAPVAQMRDEILRRASKRYVEDVRRLGASLDDALNAVTEVWSARETG
jgi:GntR family transcriptional regulator